MNTPETSKIAYREQLENGDIERMEDYIFLAFQKLGLGTRDIITKYLRQTFPEKAFTTEMIGKRFDDLKKKDKIILTDKRLRSPKTSFTSGKSQQLWALPDVNVEELLACVNKTNN